LASARRLLVALDFDGTLAPLVANPEDSRVLPAAAQALERLAAAPRAVLALVSGRPAEDLARLARPPEGTWLVGSHGAEHGRVRDHRAVIDPVVLSPGRRERLAFVTRELEVLAGGEPGAWVERKPFAAVLHTRRMADRGAAAALEARGAELGRAAGAHVVPGKMVVEVAVLPAGKAGALTRLKQATSADRLVFAGDDVTDELALRTIRPPDLGIKVGPGASAAPLRLADPAALAQFLDLLADRLGAAPS
jgi:trehalose 6-phosphate phosphatase